MGKLNMPITDHGGDVSTAGFPIADGETALNITALFDAVDGVTIGNLGQSVHVIASDADAGPGGNAASKYAQREMKWLCRYHDAVTLKKRTLEIPCAEAQLLATNTDFMDLADAGAGAAFKTAFDTHVKDPDTGNAVVLDSAELVGRK
jgi:hypothetical protein